MLSSRKETDVRQTNRGERPSEDPADGTGGFDALDEVVVDLLVPVRQSRSIRSVLLT